MVGALAHEAAEIAKITPTPTNKEDSVSQPTNTHPEVKPRVASVSSAGIGASKNTVLLNVVPVVITEENGNSTSTYAFLDTGYTDTLIDCKLAEYLYMQGTPEQIEINTIASSYYVVDSKRVLFTLTSTDGLGKVLLYQKLMSHRTSNSRNQSFQKRST